MSGALASVMPQLQLPIFSEGVHLITPHLGDQREGDEVVYLHGMMPAFLHRCDDLASFKMIVSQFYINGNAILRATRKSKAPPARSFKEDWDKLKSDPFANYKGIIKPYDNPDYVKSICRKLATEFMFLLPEIPESLKNAGGPSSNQPSI